MLPNKHRLKSLLYLSSLSFFLSACTLPQQRSDRVSDYPPQPFLANMGYCKTCYPNTSINPVITKLSSFTLESVYFETNKSQLKPIAKAKIDSIIAAIQLKHPHIILIEGHTDNRSDYNYNQHLSERRANAVKNVLTNRGVEAARITTRGYGELRPIANNHNRLGRQRNRRVEIYLQ